VFGGFGFDACAVGGGCFARGILGLGQRCLRRRVAIFDWRGRWRESR
jgi:hypothetical protein